MRRAFVIGTFDNIGSQDIRFLHEASRLGELHVFLFSDEILARYGRTPKFPLAERRYFLESIRYVHQVDILCDELKLPQLLVHSILKRISEDDVCVVRKSLSEHEDALSKTIESFCREHGLAYCILSHDDLRGFPYEPPKATEHSRDSTAEGRTRKVLVTGSFDWLHSGHIRFFEEAAMYGQLIVVVGNDANIRLLKGDGHPLYGEEERRYLVGSIRYVSEALISTGSGWLDAEPEILRLKPHMYIVNEDGDKPEKRSFCATHGIEYLVLKRIPREGLPYRSSTDLRGF